MGPRVLPTLYKILPYPGPPLSQGLSIVEYGAPSVTYIIQDSAIPRSSSQSGSIYSRVWGPECYLHYTRFCHTQVLLSVRVYLYYPGPPLSQGLSIVEYGAPSVTYIIQDSAIPRSSSQSGSIYSRVWGPECYLHYGAPSTLYKKTFCHGPECYLHYTRFSSSQSGSIYCRVWGPECYLHNTRCCHNSAKILPRFCHIH